MLSRIYSPLRRGREDGFTLIELLIVVIIIGILAAIALPIFLNQQRAAVDASVQSDVRNTVDSVATWQAANQNTAEATVTAYKNAGGKVTQSTQQGKTNTIGVVTKADGSYTVCGFNAGGKQFVTAATAFAYDTASGKFGTTASQSCPGAVDPTTGADSSGTAISSGLESGDPQLANWSGGTVSANCAHTGSNGYCVNAAVWPYNGYQAGSGTFTAATTAGTTYKMTVWLDALDGSTSYDCISAAVASQSQQVCMVYQSSGPGGSGFYTSGWVQKTFTFTATSSSTVVTFTSTNGGQYYQSKGAIDDLVISPQ